jgi:hypothetical protein
MKKYNLFLIILITFITSCAPEVYNIAFWVNKEKLTHPYKKVYILAMLNNTANNAVVENDFAKQATKRGIAHIKNNDMMPATFVNREYGKEQTLLKAKELGCDAIFTVGLKAIKTESHYVPGQTSYQPYPTYGYYNRFPVYYSNYYGQVETPGYFVNDKVYFIECNLFDVSSQEILFSIQSKTYNPSDIETISKAYCKEVCKLLEKEGIIKRAKKGKHS